MVILIFRTFIQVQIQLMYQSSKEFDNNAPKLTLVVYSFILFANKGVDLMLINGNFSFPIFIPFNSNSKVDTSLSYYRPKLHNLVGFWETAV